MVSGTFSWVLRCLKLSDFTKVRHFSGRVFERFFLSSHELQIFSGGDGGDHRVFLSNIAPFGALYNGSGLIWWKLSSRPISNKHFLRKAFWFFEASEGSHLIRRGEKICSLENLDEKAHVRSFCSAPKLIWWKLGSRIVYFCFALSQSFRTWPNGSQGLQQVFQPVLNIFEHELGGLLV